MPDTYKFERGETRQSILSPDGEGADPDRRRNLEGPRARPAGPVAGRNGHARLDRREGDRPGRRAPACRRACSSTGSRNTCGSSPIRRSSTDSCSARARSGARSAAPISIRRRPTTPMSSTACRRGRSPIRARLRSRLSPTRRTPGTSISSPTEQAGTCSPNSFDQHLKNVARWRQIEKDAKDHLAPDASPTAPSAIHGAIEPADPSAFGALVAIGPASAAPATAANPGGPGATRQDRRRSPGDGGGAVVALQQSVGRQDDRGSRRDRDRRQRRARRGRRLRRRDRLNRRIGLGRLRAAVAGDARRREGPRSQVRHGRPSAARRRPPTLPRRACRPRPLRPSRPPRAGRASIDASEGTKLDPLLNKTYDLSYAKVVPTSH